MAKRKQNIGGWLFNWRAEQKPGALLYLHISFRFQTVEINNTSQPLEAGVWVFRLGFLGTSNEFNPDGRFHMESV